MARVKRWGVYRTEGGITKLQQAFAQKKAAIDDLVMHVNTPSVQWTLKEVDLQREYDLNVSKPLTF